MDYKISIIKKISGILYQEIFLMVLVLLPVSWIVTEFAFIGILEDTAALLGEK